MGFGGNGKGSCSKDDIKVEDGEAKKKKRKDMTSEEKNQARAAKCVYFPCLGKNVSFAPWAHTFLSLQTTRNRSRVR